MNIKARNRAILRKVLNSVTANVVLAGDKGIQDFISFTNSSDDGKVIQRETTKIISVSIQPKGKIIVEYLLESTFESRKQGIHSYNSNTYSIEYSIYDIFFLTEESISHPQIARMLKQLIENFPLILEFDYHLLDDMTDSIEKDDGDTLFITKDTIVSVTWENMYISVSHRIENFRKTRSTGTLTTSVFPVNNPFFWEEVYGK